MRTYLLSVTWRYAGRPGGINRRSACAGSAVGSLKEQVLCLKRAISYKYNG